MNTTETAIQMTELSKMYLQAMNDINLTLADEVANDISSQTALIRIQKIVTEAGNKHDDIMRENAMDRAQRHRRESFPPKLGARDMHDTDGEDRTTQYNEDEYEASQR